MIFAERASATPATVPAGYSTIKSANIATATAVSCILGYKIAQSSSDTSGTWTNAAELTCHVYRPSAGSTILIGQNATSTSTTATITFPALTLADSGGNSWIVGFAGASDITQNLATAPTGMTNESTLVGASNSIAGHDTNGGVSSWSVQTTASGATGHSVSMTVELVLVAFGSGTKPPNVYQHIAGGGNCASRFLTGNAFKFSLPNASGTGNTIVLHFTFDGAQTISSVNGAVNGAYTLAKSALAGTGNEDSVCYYAKNITAGVETITITFASSVVVFQYCITELYGVDTTSPLNGSASAALSTSTATGSFTPGNNNANGGNVLLSYHCKSDNFPSQLTTGFFPGTGLQLLNADIAWVNAVDSLPKAMQIGVQATSAATNPSVTSIAETGDHWNNIGTAWALSPGAGTAPSSNLIRLTQLHHFSSTHFPATGIWAIQVSAMGNLRAVASTDPNLNTLSVWDSEGNAYTSDGNGAQFWYCANTQPNPNLIIYINGGGADASLSWRFFDASNAATTSVFVSSNVSNQVVDGLTSFTASPSPAPSGVGLSLANIGLGQGPGLGITSPSGAVSDLCTYTGETDSDGIENADLLGHFVNLVGGAQTWTFSITSRVSNSTSGGFITFAGGVGTVVKSITESTTIADIKMKQLRMLRNESISIADLLTKIGGGSGVVNTKVINELSTIVDIQMKQLKMLRTEGFSLTDVLSRAAAVRFRIINESFAVDPDGSSAIANLFLADPITVIDQLTTLGQVRTKSIAEAITIIDLLTGIHSGSGIVNSKTILESITITDNLSRAIQRARVLNEALTMADLLSRSITANRTIFDAISILDLETTIGFRNYVRSLFEAITVQDQMSNYLLKRIALLEAIAMIDVDVGIYVPYSASIVALTSPVIIGSG